MEETEKAMLNYIIFQGYDSDLTAEDFTTSMAQEIITAVNSLKLENKEISMTTIKDKFKGNETKVIQYIATLNDYVYGQDPDTLYNSIVEQSKKRKIKRTLMESFNDEDTDADVLIQKISGELNSIALRNQKEKSFMEMIADTMQDLEDTYHNRGNYSLYTGIPDLDDVIFGLHNAELTIIGARPRNRKNNFSFTDCDKNCKQWIKCGLCFTRDEFSTAD